MWFDNIPDARLFNRDDFERAFASDESPVKICKQFLLEGRSYLQEQFARDRRIDEVVYKHAWFIDQVLSAIWSHQIESTDLALVAVGGYGRGDLLPASDIDIMILTPPRLDREARTGVERFLAFLWDIGLHVGQSVRSIKECVREAKADITVVTNLIEARLICGNRKLFDEMELRTGPDRIWPTRKFFDAKIAEQAARHRRYANCEHNLEPNVKEGPGGLREIQMIGWVAKRHFGAASLDSRFTKINK